MSSVDKIKYYKMQERLDFEKLINQPQHIMVGVPLPEYTPPQMQLTEAEHEAIRQIVREEVRIALHLRDDRLLEAVQGEPDPDDEIAAILAEMTEEEFETLVQKVKGMKR